jgi:hypothetical protein
MAKNDIRHEDDILPFSEEGLRAWVAELNDFFTNTEYGQRMIEEMRIKGKARRAANNHKQALRRRKAKGKGRFSRADVELHYRSQRGRCWWCGQSLNDSYHVDHRVPLKLGGKNTPENICLACPECNLKKGAMMPGEFCGRLI